MTLDRAVASGWSAACCSRDGGLVSDRQREFSERHRQPAVHRLLDSQLVVPSTQVLDEGMPGDHDPGAAVLLAATHRPQPRLESAVVGLDPVVGVPVGAMPAAGSSSSSTSGLIRPGFCGGSIAWKAGWSHGTREEFPPGPAALPARAA